MTKVCGRCKKEKSREDFAYNKATKDKKQNYCQACMSQIAAIRKMNPKIREKYKTYIREYMRKWKEKPKNKIAMDIRASNRNIIKKLSNNMYSVKDKTVLSCFGIDRQGLLDHFEKLFKKGMSWKNYGAWHLDHIKGLATFNLTKESEQKIANHYTNIRPIWGLDNFSRKKK